MASSAEAFARAARVADAVLYEGYVLYPYRASAAKNQVRWQFGVLAPRPFAEADGSEQWAQRTEVIAELGAAGTVDVRVRFLQLQARTVEAAGPVGAGSAGEGSYTPVAQLDVGGRRWSTWDEAVEHQIEVPGVGPGPGGSRAVPITLAAGREVERPGPEGRLVRERWAVDGRVRVSVEPLPGPYRLSRLRVEIENHTAWGAEGGGRREEAVRRSLIGVHVLAHTNGGSFLSSIDPPLFARVAVAGCTNRNAFPVLIGDEGDDSTILASPIILYDRAEVAAESPGDMCDATEIDEILALRVLTLTDDEKLEARGTDDRAAAIVDRVDDFAPEIFERLHGAIRSLHPLGDGPGSPPSADPVGEGLPWWEPAADAAVDPWTDAVVVGDVAVGKGSKVTLRPGHRRADAQDLFLGGRPATVEGVFTDVDGDRHLAVTLDDDPAADLQRGHGRFLYFHPDEVEPVR